MRIGKASAGKRVLLAIPAVLALSYLGAWGVTGSPLFLPASDCEVAASPAAGPAPTPTPEPSASDQGDARLTLDLLIHPDPLQAGKPARWSFVVTNVSDEVLSLTFSSGQDGDVALFQGGAEKYRWSEGRFFTQATRTVDLAAGESYDFVLEDTIDLEDGTYELVASVVSEPAPPNETRSVTIGAGPSPTSPPASATPETSPSPGDAVPPESPSPTASGAEGGSLAPAAIPLMVLLHRRSRRWGRTVLASVLLFAASAVAPLADAQEQGGSGGKNVVIVLNETDGRLAHRAGVALGRASGPSIVPENLAQAQSRCQNCRTVAVAMQAVLVISSPTVASPHNAAVAVNVDCDRCATFAYAYQYVVSTGGPVRVTPEGNDAISSIRGRAAEVASSDLPFPMLVEELDRLAAELRGVIDSEVERVGGHGVPGRAVDVQEPEC